MEKNKNNVFKQYEEKIIASEKERLDKVQSNLNESKDTINHLTNISETYTSRLFSIIGNFLGKK